MKINSRAVLCPMITVITMALVPMSTKAEGNGYEKLKDLFESSNQAASLADFDAYGGVGKMKCLAAGPYFNFQMQAVAASQTYSVEISENAGGEGPLFLPYPRSKDVLIPENVIDYRNGYSDRMKSELDQFAREVEVQEKKTYLQVVSSSPRYGYNRPVEFDIRKSGNLIAIRVIVNANRSFRHIVAYEYCWKE